MGHEIDTCSNPEHEQIGNSRKIDSFNQQYDSNQLECWEMCYIQES